MANVIRNFKYFSTFSGIGGIELGIQLAYEYNNNQSITSIEQNRKRGNRNINVKPALLHGGSKPPLCVGYSETDKYAVQVYKKHFNHKNYGDIRKIKEQTLPDFDLLVGGFPCQAFSIAGKRGGFNDTRGTLFFDVARIIKQKQPRLLLLENVKGLLSHDKGRTFFTIISTLDELGYDCQWQVLNSKNHGVPQNRERVYIIGHLRETPRPKVFPITGEGGASCKIIGRLDGLNGHDYLKRVYSPEGSSPTLPTGTGGNHEAKFEVDGKIRKLTPIECERLQGFPDDWTKYGSIESNPGIDSTPQEINISDAQRYKTLGNAVTVNVVRDVMTRLNPF